MADDFTQAADPLDVFARWLQEAARHEVNDPNAMSLATADAQGTPNLRMVLLNGFDADGFVFYTNLESQKGQELKANPRASACFHWKSLRRQVRLRGPVAAVSDDQADDYFRSRPRGSRIGAWASRQSQPLASRAELVRAVARYAGQFGAGPVPRPPHWSGFRIRPLEIEFWRNRTFRLHDRIRFTRRTPDHSWIRERLYP